MATATDPAPLKNMEALLECSICTETLTQPCHATIRFVNIAWRILLRLKRKQSRLEPKYQKSLNVQYAEQRFTSKKENSNRHQNIKPLFQQHAGIAHYSHSTTTSPCKLLNASHVKLEIPPPADAYHARAICVLNV